MKKPGAFCLTTLLIVELVLGALIILGGLADTFDTYFTLGGSLFKIAFYGGIRTRLQIVYRGLTCLVRTLLTFLTTPFPTIFLVMIFFY